MSRATITVPMTLRLTDGGQLVRVRLSYDPADPYAATLDFPTVDPPLRWCFARDLLRDGLRLPAGAGDVQVWPLPDTPHLMALRLSSPDGTATFDVPRDAVIRFVRLAYELVPRWTEPERIDWDTELANLLRTAS